MPAPSARSVAVALDEWVDWHDRYATDPTRARRLRQVQAWIREALDAAPPGPIRVVSLCSGDGRDLLGVLRRHRRAKDVRARLVDLSPELTERARARAEQLGLKGIEARCADAGSTESFRGATPADLVLACGIFGNITDAAVHRTARALGAFCATDATVIWTRGRVAPDLTPTVRRWFVEAGFEDGGFVKVPGGTGSVGRARWRRAGGRLPPARRMFRFLERRDRVPGGGARRKRVRPSGRRGAAPASPGAARRASRR